ncbi:MAG: DUF5788 family protein [Candidatus Jordarchaeum sp.]|uniref:DUF5788 family protein n=1 Tax=Candidatus Jordarchaeum sp. TaxID=2823881 RepID=UPI0040491912
MWKSKKERVIHKLSSPFSYTNATVPESICIKGKEVKLESIVDEFEDREIKGNLTSRDIIFGATLSRLLENEILRVISDIERGKISPEEAEKNLDTWLGMLRASKFLKKPEEKMDTREIEKDEKVVYVKWAKKFMDSELFAYRW